MLDKSKAHLSGGLLVISGLTHVFQLAVYGTAGHVKAAAAFGVAYLILGIALWGRSSVAVLWLGVLLPSLGGVLGAVRWCFFPNPFSIFHICVDAAVIFLCLSALRARRTS